MSGDDPLNERDLFGNDPDDGISLGSILVALCVVVVGGLAIWWLL